MPYETIKTDKHFDLVHAEQVCDIAIANGYQSIAVATGSHLRRSVWRTFCGNGIETTLDGVRRSKPLWCS